LEQIELLLRPFQAVTKYLEGNAVHGHYGLIWKALPAIKLLLNKLEKVKTIYKYYKFLSTSINLIWSKLDEYYKLIASAIEKDQFQVPWATPDSYYQNAKCPDHVCLELTQSIQCTTANSLYSLCTITVLGAFNASS
jgi:hypothetical protein